MYVCYFGEYIQVYPWLVGILGIFPSFTEYFSSVCSIFNICMYVILVSISRFTLGWWVYRVYSILEATFCLASRKWFSHRTLKSRRIEGQSLDKVGKKVSQHSFKSRIKQFEFYPFLGI